MENYNLFIGQKRYNSNDFQESATTTEDMSGIQNEINECLQAKAEKQGELENTDAEFVSSTEDSSTSAASELQSQLAAEQNTLASFASAVDSAANALSGANSLVASAAATLGGQQPTISKTDEKGNTTEEPNPAYYEALNAYNAALAEQAQAQVELAAAQNELQEATEICQSLQEELQSILEEDNDKNQEDQEEIKQIITDYDAQIEALQQQMEEIQQRAQDSQNEVTEQETPENLPDDYEFGYEDGILNYYEYDSNGNKNKDKTYFELKTGQSVINEDGSVTRTDAFGNVSTYTTKTNDDGTSSIMETVNNQINTEAKFSVLMDLDDYKYSNFNTKEEARSALLEKFNTLYKLDTENKDYNNQLKNILIETIQNNGMTVPENTQDTTEDYTPYLDTILAQGNDGDRQNDKIKVEQKLDKTSATKIDLDPKYYYHQDESKKQEAIENFKQDLANSYQVDINDTKSMETLLKQTALANGLKEEDINNMSSEQIAEYFVDIANNGIKDDDVVNLASTQSINDSLGIQETETKELTRAQSEIPEIEIVEEAEITEETEKTEETKEAQNAKETEETEETQNAQETKKTEETKETQEAKKTEKTEETEETEEQKELSRLAEEYLGKTREECTQEELQQATVLSYCDDYLASMTEQFDTQVENEGAMSTAFNGAKQNLDFFGLAVSRDEVREALQNQQDMIDTLKESLKNGDFKETWAAETGVKFDAEKIQDYFSSQETFVNAQTGLYMVTNFQNEVAKAQSTDELLDLYTQYYGDETKAREEVSQIILDSCNTSINITAPESIRIDENNNVYFKDFGSDEEYLYSSLSDMNIDSELFNARMNNNYSTKYINEYKEKYEKATGIAFDDLEENLVNIKQEAFGNADKIEEVVQEYCDSQNGFADKVSGGLQWTGGIMTAVGFVACLTGVGAGAGSALMTAGAWVAGAGTFADNTIEIVDALTSDNPEANEIIKKELKDGLFEAAVMLATVGIAKGISVAKTNAQSKLLETLTQTPLDMADETYNVVGDIVDGVFVPNGKDLTSTMVDGVVDGVEDVVQVGIKDGVPVYASVADEVAEQTAKTATKEVAEEAVGEVAEQTTKEAVEEVVEETVEETVKNNKIIDFPETSTNTNEVNIQEASSLVDDSTNVAVDTSEVALQTSTVSDSTSATAINTSDELITNNNEAIVASATDEAQELVNNEKIISFPQSESVSYAKAAGAESSFVDDSIVSIEQRATNILPAGQKLQKDVIYSISENSNPTINVGRQSIDLNELDFGDKTTITIGRGSKCDVVFADDVTVSREHLEITKLDGQYYIRDLGSRNGTQIFSGSKITNTDELCRVAGNNGKAVSETYVKNNELAREVFIDGISSKESLESVEGYVKTLNEAHVQAYKGSGLYYQKNGHLVQESEMHSGVQRVGGNLVNGRTNSAKQVQQLAEKYGDSYNYTKARNTVQLEGISKENLPFDTYIDNKYQHWYPEGNALAEYNEQLFRTHKETILEIQNYISGNTTQEDVLKSIAEHYQYGANARPYANINNSLFMNEVNTYLELAGMPKMTQGELLDHAAQRLQPENFVKYFIDYYSQNQVV